MSAMKEVDRLVNEIADVLGINPDTVSLSQIPGGWFADADCAGKNIEGSVGKDPIKAMENLLEKVNHDFKTTHQILWEQVETG